MPSKSSIDISTLYPIFHWYFNTQNQCLKSSHDRVNPTSSLSMILFHIILFVMWSLLRLTPPRCPTICELDTSWVSIVSHHKFPSIYLTSPRLAIPLERLMWQLYHTRLSQVLLCSKDVIEFVIWLYNRYLFIV